MKYRMLGDTGLKVSRLCYGVLTLGPLQANLPLAEGVELLKYAVGQGVNFFDTAEIYEAYPLLRALLLALPDDRLVIASKSYAVTAGEAAASLEKARREMNRDVVDIFLLHEQESAATIRGHRAALDYLVEAREKGLIRAVGISTHRVAGVRGALEFPEIQVVHPLFNIRGLGIHDGTREDMLDAINLAAQAGKGIYLMKALGGGNLLAEGETALRYAFSLESAAAVAVGMKTRAEIDYNIRIACGLPVDDSLKQAVSTQVRTLHIDEWCEGCGKCALACPQGALALGPGGRMSVNRKECLLCGYCARACPNFFIKVY